MKSEALKLWCKVCHMLQWHDPEAKECWACDIDEQDFQSILLCRGFEIEEVGYDNSRSP